MGARAPESLLALGKQMWIGTGLLLAAGAFVTSSRYQCENWLVLRKRSAQAGYGNTQVHMHAEAEHFAQQA